MIERMRPAKGKPWDSRAHRMADALVELCRHYEGCDTTDRATLVQPLLVVQVPLDGPAEVGGVALPHEMVAELRATAKVEPVLVDDHGPISIGRVRSSLSPKIVRAVLARDGHRCRNCGTTHGLHVHHLTPVTWGGTDDPANLATVCGTGNACHPALVPHGDWILEGNPNHPRRHPPRPLDQRHPGRTAPRLDHHPPTTRPHPATRPNTQPKTLTG